MDSKRCGKRVGCVGLVQLGRLLGRRRQLGCGPANVSGRIPKAENKVNINRNSFAFQNVYHFL